MDASGTIIHDESNLLNFECVELKCDRGMLRGPTGGCECPMGQYLDVISDSCETCSAPFVLKPTEDETRGVCVCPEGFVKAGGTRTCVRCGEGMLVRSRGHQRWCACREGFYEDPNDETVCRRCPDGMELVFDDTTDEPRCRCPARSRKAVVQKPNTFGRSLDDYDVVCEPVEESSQNPLNRKAPAAAPFSDMSVSQFRSTFGITPAGMDAKNEPITPLWIKELMPRPAPSPEMQYFMDSDSSPGSLTPTLTIGSRRPKESLSNWILYAFSHKDYLYACHKFAPGVSTSPVPDSDLRQAAARGEYTLGVSGLPEAGLIVLFKDARNDYSCPGTGAYGVLRLHEMPFFNDLEPETLDLHDKLLYESDALGVDFNGLGKIAEVW